MALSSAVAFYRADCGRVGAGAGWRTSEARQQEALRDLVKRPGGVFRAYHIPAAVFEPHLDLHDARHYVRYGVRGIYLKSRCPVSHWIVRHQLQSCVPARLTFGLALDDNDAFRAN